jgi:hypothetical protein
MSLEEETKLYINIAVKHYYTKAIEYGAKVSEIQYVGTNVYKIKVGKMELAYIGTADGRAQLLAASGNVF